MDLTRSAAGPSPTPKGGSVFPEPLTERTTEQLLDTALDTVKSLRAEGLSWNEVRIVLWNARSFAYTEAQR